MWNMGNVWLLSYGCSRSVSSLGEVLKYWVKNKLDKTSHFPSLRFFYSQECLQGSKRLLHPTGRMILGPTVIMFKDTDSAQFLLEQSGLECKIIPFCGCHVLLKELVTTCWRGVGVIYRGQLDNRYFIHLFWEPFIFASSSQFAFAAFTTLWHVVWIVWNDSDQIAERMNVCRIVKTMENARDVNQRAIWISGSTAWSFLWLC